MLETARLKLRGHRLDDFAACSAMWADPVVTRYIGGKPLTEEEAWTKLLRYAGHWSLLGFGYWAVEEKETGRFIGELGFADYKRSIQPSLGDAPEAGWIFSPGVHGKGYASEALREVLAWGEVRFTGGPTVCLIHPGMRRPSAWPKNSGMKRSGGRLTRIDLRSCFRADDFRLSK